MCSVRSDFADWDFGERAMTVSLRGWVGETEVESQHSTKVHVIPALVPGTHGSANCSIGDRCTRGHEYKTRDDNRYFAPRTAH